MNLMTTFYSIKPLIPRGAQLALRRIMARRKRERAITVWPISEDSSCPPDGWAGWPQRKKFALILGHDVDTEKGHANSARLMKLEERLGFRSSFNFVPHDYEVSSVLRRDIENSGFEVGVHGLTHDGLLFSSRKLFNERAPKINNYLREWRAVGFYSPAMYRNAEWIAEFDIEYACSTFDTDPFEPQQNNVGTIFPLMISSPPEKRAYVELPYTMPQDHLLFIILKEPNIDIWLRKLDWIAEKGGMVRLNTHPDYMNFSYGKCSGEEYPITLYEDLLAYIRGKYQGQYWHVLPRELAEFWKMDAYRRGTSESPRSRVHLIG